jgi:hypothetical protein
MKVTRSNLVILLNQVLLFVSVGVEVSTTVLVKSKLVHDLEKQTNFVVWDLKQDFVSMRVTFLSEKSRFKEGNLHQIESKKQI